MRTALLIWLFALGEWMDNIVYLKTGLKYEVDLHSLAFVLVLFFGVAILQDLKELMK